MIQSELRKKGKELVFKSLKIEDLKKDKKFGKLFVNIKFILDGSPFFQEYVDYLDEIDYLNTRLFDNYFDKYSINDLNEFIENNVEFKIEKQGYELGNKFDQNSVTRHDYCFNIIKENFKNKKLNSRVYKYKVTIKLNPKLDENERFVDVKKLVPMILRCAFLNDDMDIYY